MPNFVGSRRINTNRPMPTISVTELQQLRENGRNIVERPDGTVVIDQFKKFRVTGEELAEVMDKDNVGLRTKPVEPEIEGLSGGNDLTGFDFKGANESGEVNALTDFDAQTVGQTPGGNELIDFN